MTATLNVCGGTPMHGRVVVTRRCGACCAVQVSRYGVDAAGVAGEVSEGGCAVRLVLLPFGQDKEDLEEYQVGGWRAVGWTVAGQQLVGDSWLLSLKIRWWTCGQVVDMLRRTVHAEACVSMPSSSLAVCSSVTALGSSLQGW